MGFLQISNVSLKGISAAVPSMRSINSDFPLISPDERQKFISATGIKEKRISGDEICTSDLCFSAAENLLGELEWGKETIDILIFVTQTPDYILPSTAPILQSRLGLNESCLSFDISMGCSGYIYGLSVISSLLSHGNIKRGILLVGDTISKTCSELDKSTYPLFGDAGTATALEFDKAAQGFRFNLSSDGKGYKSIIIKDGGFRNRVTENSFKNTLYEPQISRNNLQLEMDGMNVFSFGISKAPQSVLQLMERFAIDGDTVDYYVFHQANLFMNEMIRQKIKLPREKVPYSLEKFGNSSSATIPLTLVANLRANLKVKKLNLIFCGFGVGLSWGSAFLTTDRIVCPEIIEI